MKILFWKSYSKSFTQKFIFQKFHSENIILEILKSLFPKVFEIFILKVAFWEAKF